MPKSIVPVILCGGAGSRLWPVSRQLLPKQFLPLVTGRTLLQDTALRAREAAGGAQPHRDLQRSAPLPGAGPACGNRHRRAHRARARGPQHRGRGRGRRARLRKGRSGAAGARLRPRDPRRRAFNDAVRRAADVAAAGHAGDLRHRAGAPRQRLRLHRARRPVAGRGRRVQGRALRREAGRSRSAPPHRHRPRLLEQRHVRVRREAPARRARPLPARHPGCGAQGVRTAQATTWVSCGWARRPSSPVRPKPSTAR